MVVRLARSPSSASRSHRPTGKAPAPAPASGWRAKLRDAIEQRQGASMALRRASHASLLAMLAGMPRELQQEQRQRAKQLWGTLYVELFYGGDEARCNEDLAFYVDGSALVARDFRRRGHLLLDARRPAAMSDTERQARSQLQCDVGSLLMFALIALNTFPLTPAVVSTLLERAPWLPRSWILPSQFEPARLSSLRRARQGGLRGAGAAVQA